MLEEVTGRRLRAVERFAWRSHDGSPVELGVGSVHLWFENGRGVHLDGAGDRTLKWSVSEPGDDQWMGQYLYDFHGRWVIREAANEMPFDGLAGSTLTSAAPVFNEMNEVVGLTLRFEDRTLTLSLWEGEIKTSPR